MGKPNIVLITTDSQRWDTLRCMGSEFAISPHLDRLASEGVLFEQAHTASPVCMPTRCTLLTGVHTPIHGCIENGISRRGQMPVFTDKLKELGYRTIMVGKTHFGPMPASFDVAHVVSEKSQDVDDAYGRYISPLGYSRVSKHPNPVPEELFMEAFLVDTAIREIENASAAGGAENDEPFFVFCSMVSPHDPLDPPGRFATLYDDVELPPVNYVDGEAESFPAHMKRLIGLGPKGNGHKIEDHSMEEIDHERRLYYGSAAYCDEQVGRLVDYLDGKGLRDNTLIVFTSDHGQQLMDHGFNDKHNYYDSSWRVPFIMSMPGTLPSGEKRDFAVWSDIPATILGAAGGSMAHIQGFDLFTPLAQGQPSPRRCAVATLYKSAAMATERWKLEYYFEERTGRLFDRLNDPLERTDLFDSAEHRDIRSMMVEALLGWRSDLSDVHELIEGTGGGGPVARRIAPHTKAMRGVDSEIRLNEWAERLPR